MLRRERGLTARRIRAVVPSLVLFATTGGIAASKNHEPIALYYEALEGCPSRAEFAKRVQSIEAAATFAEEGSLEFSVALRKKGRSVEGTFVRRDNATKADEGKRTIAGETCDEVADAMALAAALAFTEVLEERERAEKNATERPPESKVELEEEASDEPAKEEEKSAVASTSEILVLTRFRGTTVLGPAPSLGADLGLEFIVAFGEPWRGAARVFGGYARADGGEVVLESVPYGGLMVCPLEYVAGRGFLGLCGETTLARLGASAGTGIRGPLAASYRPFPTLSAQVRAGVAFGAFRLDASVGVESALASLEYRVVGTSGETSDRTVLALEPGPAGVFGVSVGYRIPWSE